MIGDITNPVERFVAFIEEREAIRQRREGGVSWPWTEEPILQQYRFCNVHREDDKVSKHYQKTVRNRYGEDELVFPASVLYRWFNRPETCDFLFSQPDFNFQSTFERYIELYELEILLHRIRMTPTPHITGAYVISSMPGHPKGEGILRYFHRWCEKDWRYLWNNWKSRPTTLLEIYDYIGSQGLGDFMKAQIIADLKYLPFLKQAEDWWTFAAPGPGSKKGLNIVLGADMDSPWTVNSWRVSLDELSDIVTPQLVAIGIGKLHNQDLQNCLCEFSKFEKVRTGVGRPRQVYHPC